MKLKFLCDMSPVILLGLLGFSGFNFNLQSAGVYVIENENFHTFVACASTFVDRSGKDLSLLHAALLEIALLFILIEK